MNDKGDGDEVQQSGGGLPMLSRHAGADGDPSAHFRQDGGKTRRLNEGRHEPLISEESDSCSTDR